MQTLDAPVFEVKQDSEWFKQKMKQGEDQRRIFKILNDKYFKDDGFAYYHSEYFGVYGDSKDYETYKEELVKNPDKNGIYIFKKRSKYFKVFKELLEEIEEISPFKSHDVFGLNNVKASQWIKGRWFFEVKNEEDVKGDEVAPVSYKEYLSLVMEVVENGGNETC